MKTRTPSGLSKKSQGVWREILRRYDIQFDSLIVLENSLVFLDEADKLKARIDKEGFMVQMKDGKPKAHPLLPALKESRQAFLRTWRLLGFEPAREVDFEGGRGRPVEGYGRQGR